MIGDFSSDAAPIKPTVMLEAEAEELPIDRLTPGSDLHAQVLAKLLERLQYSEREMGNFYNRWNYNERRIQAYINLPKYEQMLKEMNDKGTPPQVTDIIVPYSYATIWTIVTYMVHVFCGQKPMFQVGAHKEESVKAAQYMETVLQYNADHTRLILQLIQWFLDSEVYGMGAVRALWTEEKRLQSKWIETSPGGMMLPSAPKKRMRQRTLVTVYEGNKVTSIDPYMFFPDPRVPMTEVNRRGEFVFWRSFEGKHTLKREEALGTLKHVDAVGSLPRNKGENQGQSQRSLIAKGNSQAGDPSVRTNETLPFIQVDQGTIEIVPSEWGLGDSNDTEKWIFSIGNKNQIIQAEPFDHDHGRHPVSVIEPSSFGYAFGNAGTADFLGPIQDTLSWFVNSHIHNVRTALNNMFVVDPSMVEIQDLKTPGAGKIIRLKRAAIGQDVRSAIMQLNVQDVTTNHMQSMEMFLKIGDVLSSVNDNLRGIQDSGGRKTATEVRTAGEAGASRLAARARLISAQGMVDLAEQMSLNIQQFQSMEFYLKVVGAKGMEAPIPITPEMVAGDFHFPIHDGTLPIDKTAILGVWKEIFLAVSQNPLLARSYDGGKIFEYIAELSGAKNIGEFRIQTASPEAIAQGMDDGSLQPLGPGAAGSPSPSGGAPVPQGGPGVPGL